MASKEVREAKICLIGDSGVGKTAIATRFVQERFVAKDLATIGVSYLTKDVKLGPICYRLQLWDTAGQDRYRSLVPLYYRGTSAAIIVYDISDQGSYESVRPWVNELRRHCQDNPVVTVAGNKCDLESDRKISYDEARAKAESCGAAFMETSAMSATNTTEIFVDICERLKAREEAKLEETAETQAESLENLAAELETKKRRGCCS